MTLALYAPMKPPDHPVPSGDRTMARGVIAALRHAGFNIEVASHLQTRDGSGDANIQAAVTAEAQAALPALTEKGKTAGWRAWVTYHNYYKAPDLLGPAVARALSIPYIQIEATRARKRLSGPWAGFAKAAEYACDQAQLIFYLTQRDAETLRRDAPMGQQLVHLRPFLPRTDLPRASTLQGPMLAVGMMRAGDKLASYAVIAEVLAALPTDGWHLDIAGDGPARPEVAALMAPFGTRVTFRGALDATALETAYGHAQLLLWPGVNEAFGMIYLEAQAHGVPVIAQDRPGVRDVLAPGSYPAPEAGPVPLARRIAMLQGDSALHQTSARQARAHIAESHLLSHAAQVLSKGLAHLGVRP